jgi:Putative Actinobacterial Holin-X, holin superfamily III
MTDEPSPISEAAKPTIKMLLGQLANDTSDFARAEIDYLRAQAGERASFALPGLLMVGVAAALGFGAIIALLIGLIWLIGERLGMGWALLIVIGAAIASTVLLGQMGAARLRNALKARDDR